MLVGLGDELVKECGWEGRRVKRRRKGTKREGGNEEGRGRVGGSEKERENRELGESTSKIALTNHTL